MPLSKIKKYSDYDFVRITGSEGIFWRFFSKFVSNDKLLQTKKYPKITILS